MNEEDVYAPKADLPQTITNPTEDKGPMNKLGSGFIDFIQTFVVFGAIFAMVYLFVAQPHKVSGSSMVPTFHDGDYIMTDKVTYRLKEPSHDEVIVLKNPRDESVDFIKRIIAVPGDTVSVQGGKVYVNGTQIPENYLPAGTVTQAGSFLNEGESIQVAPGQYFVFGDNRNHSSDSREWGPITKQEIVGKVFVRYWPPNAVGIIRN